MTAVPALPTCPPALIEVSRRLGAHRDWVLHGGGNTSVKTSAPDIDGSAMDVLWMKASGSDLAQSTAASFAPLRLAQLRRLLSPVRVPDDRLLNELRSALVRADAADPSVETLAHVAIDTPCVLHTHPDALLALGHTAEGRDELMLALGSSVVFVDYAMPGPDLVEAVATAWQQRPAEIAAVVVWQHGIFVGGDDCDDAWDRHAQIMGRVANLVPMPHDPDPPVPPAPDGLAIATMRRRVCDLAGQSLVAAHSPAARWVNRDDVLASTGNGPLTPDHATRTKPWPLIGDDVDAYAAKYRAYFHQHNGQRGQAAAMLDPAPRVVISPELGLLGFGRTPDEARAAREITEHTLTGIESALELGDYQSVGDTHLFDLEYWSLQQQKLARTRLPRQTGRVALVTGAASGIGYACAQALLAAGAAVVGWDLNPSVVDAFDDPSWLGQVVDVTDASSASAAIEVAVREFGGLDIVVPSAGIFPSAAHLGELGTDVWRKVMAVNTDAVALLYGLVAPYLKVAVPHGNVVVIASKNVAAPGPGAAAYSASKAALTQLSRVAALEWAPHGVRVNMLHPDAVFDTGLWTPELLEARAEHYGMSVDEYKRRNLLRTEVRSAQVGALAEAMASPLFEPVTGAQIPIDGGNERVI